MADSLREKILARIVTVLAPATGVSGRIYRSQADAQSRDKAPFITVGWTNEEELTDGTVLAERLLTVEVAIYTRGAGPDTLADPIAQSVHALIMADTTLNGNAIDCRMGGAAFEFESADKTAGKLTHEYLVMFRHSHSDLTA